MKERPLRRRHATCALALLPLVAGLLACDEGAAPEGELVAEAADHYLTVEETVGLLSGQPDLPAREDVVRAVTDLWIDYTLLATEAAEDTLLADLDLTPLLRQQIEQEMILELRDSVIQVDTALTDEELRDRFSREAPGVQIRARHILIAYPEGATAAQRDSVMEVARGIRERAVGGEEFAALAGEYSDDPGSAAQGGDLGFFGRGQMVPTFEEAAFGLDEGEISEPVESPYGVHIIQLVERRAPEFDSVATRFRQQVQTQMQIAAESTYVEGIEGPADVTLAEDAVEAAKGIAERPGSSLSRRAANRPLVEYEGGAFTVGEFQIMVQNLNPSTRSRFLLAPDEQIEDFLRGLTRTELLVREAESAGFGVTEAQSDSMGQEARDRFVQAVERLGLRGVSAEPGETQEQAIEREVRAAIGDILAGQREVLPLGAIAFQLRGRYDARIYDAGVDSATARLQASQAQRGPQQQLPTLPDSLMPPAGGDTAGAGGSP